ncbi:hypothetical protein MCEGE14_02094 [Burkholderiaceae bacterium]
MQLLGTWVRFCSLHKLENLYIAKLDKINHQLPYPPTLTSKMF